MRKLATASAVASLFVAWLAFDAVAQGQPPQAQQPQRAQQKQESQISKGLQPGTAKASDLIGKNVQNQQGESLGKVRDFVIDRGANRMAVVVFEPSGEARRPPAAPGAQPGAPPPPAPDRYVAMPWGLLSESNGKLTLSAEKGKLTPKFSEDRWPTMDRQWVETVYKDFGQTAYTGGQQAKAEFVRASQFIGKNARNPQSEKLGTIEDIVFDMKSGEVRYAVLSAGGFLGIGDKLFAIPLSAFSPSTDGKEYVLQADKERLKKAEGFDKGNWPMTASREWAQPSGGQQREGRQPMTQQGEQPKSQPQGGQQQQQKKSY